MLVKTVKLSSSQWKRLQISMRPKIPTQAGNIFSICKTFTKAGRQLLKFRKITPWELIQTAPLGPHTLIHINADTRSGKEGVVDIDSKRGEIHPDSGSGSSWTPRWTLMVVSAQVSSRPLHRYRVYTGSTFLAVPSFATQVRERFSVLLRGGSDTSFGGALLMGCCKSEETQEDRDALGTKLRAQASSARKGHINESIQILLTQMKEFGSQCLDLQKVSKGAVSCGSRAAVRARCLSKSGSATLFVFIPPSLLVTLALLDTSVSPFSSPNQQKPGGQDMSGRTQPATRNGGWRDTSRLD